MKKFYEILPASLTWLVFILMILASWKIPQYAAIFIILFDIYWLLKTFFLSLHLRVGFKKMRENLKINWQEKLQIEFKNDWLNIYHLVIFPMYNEPLEVVKESFESLEKSNYPKDKLIVILAQEERAITNNPSVAQTAIEIKRQFGDIFHKLLVTIHPANLEGEIPGKGSNETWAAKEAVAKIIEAEKIDKLKVIVSVFDIDSKAPENYFSRLTYVYLSTPDRNQVIYQPIPLFINNIYQAPALARVVSLSSTFWQTMQQARPERLTTFSSQSIPLKVLLDVNYWDRDIVSEDSRIFWQCYLKYNGNFSVIPLYFPIMMDANAAPTFWKTMVNLYKQQRRWAWGSENIPYLLEGFQKNKLIPLRKKIYWAFNVIEGFNSWATNAILIFAMGWLPIILGGDKFHYTLLSYSLPGVTKLLMTLASIGIISSAIINIIILPPKPQWFKSYHYVWYVLQWFLMPITLIVFGAIPAIEAQTRLALGGKFRLGFWVTPKTRSYKK